MKLKTLFLAATIVVNVSVVNAAVPGSLGSAMQLAPVSQSAKMGPFAVGYEFCQRVQQIAPILMAYSSVMWPIAGVPGFTFGMVQNESVIMKVCDFIVQLENLDTTGAIMHTARFGNELTGNKWDSHLTQADLTFNVANSIYDVKGNGGFRQGALTSAHNHKMLMDFADKSAKYVQNQNRKPGDPEPEGVEDKYERQRKLDEVANLSYQRAILSDATSCPVENTKTDNQALWQREVANEQLNINKRRENVKYYELMLRKMGPDFINEVPALQEYITKLEGLVDRGFKFDYNIRYNEIPRKAATGKLQKDGTPEVKDSKEKKPYQFITLTSNSAIWSDFNNKYVKQWEKWIGGQTLMAGSFGLLDGKKGRLEAKYRDLSFECSEIQLEPTLPIKVKSDPQYYPKLKEAIDKCKDNLKVREADFKNLMQKYVTLLQQDLYSAKTSQSKIWTFESKFIGTMPLKKESTNARENQKEAEYELKVIQAPQKDCRAEFTPAEMSKLSLELQNVNNALTESIVKTQTEKSIIADKRAQAQAQNMEKFSEDSKSTVDSAKNSPTNVNPPVVIESIKGI